MCAQLHFNICKEIWVKLDNRPWYDCVPKSVETSHEGKVTILWNQKVRTDRTIPNNKPDFIIRNNNKGSCMLIDVAIPGQRNVTRKEDEKILKYKDLILKAQRMWNVKAKVIPVITGATGTISKSDNTWATYQESTKLRNYKKTATLGTEHILWEVLIIKYKTRFTCDITLHVA